MNHISTSAADRRQNYRLAIHHHSRITFALDGPEPEDEAIHSVTLTDISHEGLMAANAGELVPGARVLLEVPLVGWREAEVRWIAGNRAGCRFVIPLNLDELRLAAASSERLAGECPALAALIGKRAIGEVAGSEATTPAPRRIFWSWRTGILALVVLTAASFASATWLLNHFG